MFIDLAAGKRLHCVFAGEGSGLLFIHGAGGNAAVWGPQFEAFAETHRVVAYDLPGFGLSSAPDLARLEQDLIEAACAALDAAGLQRASVVAQSLGGWTGLRLALTQPERVERLVLCCTMAGIAHPPALAAFLAARARMGQEGPASLALSEAFRQERPLAAYLYSQVSAFNPPLDPALAAAVFAPDFLLPIERLAEVKCPVLLLTAEHDAIWPPASLEGLVAAFPNARLEMIPGSGHSPAYEQPEVANAIIRRFLG